MVLATYLKGDTIFLPRWVTYCTIEEMFGTRDDQTTQEVCKGYSVCQPGDGFSKETGRQQALDMALDELPDFLSAHDLGFQWIYDNRPRQPKKVKPELLRQIQGRKPDQSTDDDIRGSGLGSTPAGEVTA